MEQSVSSYNLCAVQLCSTVRLSSVEPVAVGRAVRPSLPARLRHRNLALNLPVFFTHDKIFLSPLHQTCLVEISTHSHFSGLTRDCLSPEQVDNVLQRVDKARYTVEQKTNMLNIVDMRRYMPSKSGPHEVHHPSCHEVPSSWSRIGIHEQRVCIGVKNIFLLSGKCV